MKTLLMSLVETKSVDFFHMEFIYFYISTQDGYIVLLPR